MGKSSMIIFLFVIMNIVFQMEELEGASSVSINNSNITCNGTTEDCNFFLLEDEIEEFQIQGYSVRGRWILQAQGTISSAALQRAPICPTPQYANCLDTQNKRCSPYNRCNRMA